MNTPAVADPETLAEVAAVIDRLQSQWSGREVLMLVQSYSAGDQSSIDELASLGATVVAVVTAGPPAPDAPPVPHVWCCARERLTNMEFDAWLADPPATFAEWLRGLDPHHRWVVLGNPFTHVSEVLGWRVHGWRRPQWAALEDKTRIDAFWQSAGVPAPAHAVVPIGSPDIADHFDALRTPLGVVLAMDSTRAYFGDAKGLRWVRSAEELDAAVGSCGGQSDHLRIAPFVRGVPCSILGMVLERGVAVFDPIEVVTLRDETRSRLVFCGTSTAWRPGAATVEEIRLHARNAGRRLADDVGFRGFFSADGIWSDDGFVATELNPRHASGLGLRAAWPRFPINMFQRAVQDSDASVADLRPSALEGSFRPLIRRCPSLSVRVPTPQAPFTTAGVRELVTVEKPVPKRQVIRYRTDGGRTHLQAVTPALSDGTAAPAAAALARALSGSGLTSFRDDSIRAVQY